MKWIIASDIHGSVSSCEMLLENFEKEKGERLILLGDLLYHGPGNNLPEGYATRDVSAMLNEFVQKTEIAAVRGNCDAEVDQYVLDFSITDDYRILWDGKHYLFATHGHIYNENEHPFFTPGTILLHGHTHLSKYVEYPGFTYINPGSVSIPRDKNGKSFLTFDGSEFVWKNLDGKAFMHYTIKERN